VHFAVELHTLRGLNSIAHTHNASLFMIVHAALATMLSGMSGLTDIAIATPIARRGERALDDLVGTFVNVVLLRTEVDNDAPFTDFLAHVRRADLDAFKHGDLPFYRVMDILNATTSIPRQPFQVLLAFENFRRPPLALPGLSVSAKEIDLSVAKCDLQLTLSEERNDIGELVGMSGAWTYATALFDESTMHTFARHFARIMTAVVSCPSIRLGQLARME
jgi:non-ribosomal peptide synthetase component F